ncbi:hypothetical protein YTPLAS21_19520 [Candidatus Nitrosocosmicus sp.]|nr:hypothetical protein YTPLAS21_19520 [Candidatus Nitrosocosmicus sp.]
MHITLPFDTDLFDDNDNAEETVNKLIEEILATIKKVNSEDNTNVNNGVLFSTLFSIIGGLIETTYEKTDYGVEIYDISLEFIEAFLEVIKKRKQERLEERSHMH